MEQHQEYDYIVNNYLNRVSLSLLGLDRLGIYDGKNAEFELLSMNAFNDALYGLLYASTITGLEEYLRIRLKVEVFKNKEAMREYVKKVNGTKGIYHIDVPSLFSDGELSNNDREKVIESLHRQIYHQIDIVEGYYQSLSGFKKEMCPSWGLIEPLVKFRNRIIHNGKYDNQGTIEVNSYSVHQALDTIRKFIDEVESAFVKLGSERIIIAPDE